MIARWNWATLLRPLPLALIAVAAFWLRTHDLDRRPMHADEANQAVKLGQLLDAGHYAFDPSDHHGPTLYFAAVPVAWLQGERSLATLTETTVRLVPALFGTVSVVLLGWLVIGSGPTRTTGVDGGDTAGNWRDRTWMGLTAAAFLAVSPPSVYYSRYFIQETLLVTFSLATFLAVQAWWRSGQVRFAVAAGVCVGLMQATKASAPLFLAAGAVALMGSFTCGQSPARSRSRLQDGMIAAGVAVLTAALLYSSLGTNLAGLRDAFAVYGKAITRFGVAAAPTGHEKPWWYYLRIFGWHREGGLLWYQAVFTVLGLAGLIVAVTRREAILRWAAIYTLLIAGAFSVFAYKTPWHAVHFVPGLAILAGATIAAIARLRTGRLVAAAFAFITCATLFQQTWRAAFLRPADQRNPYAYVHSSSDVLKIRPLAEAAVARAPDRPIRVISEEYWPLPWYLRGLKNVGYWSAAPEACDGSLIIASIGQAEAVRARLHGNYHESILGLRPGVLCVIFRPDP